MSKEKQQEKERIEFYESRDKTFGFYSNQPSNFHALPSGSYKILISQMGQIYFKKFDSKDQPNRIKTAEMDFLSDNLSSFFNNGLLYNVLKANHFLGVLLYGPPGTGKTSSLNSLSLEVSKQFETVYTLYLDSDTFESMREVYNILKKSAENSKIIFIVEECDQVFSKIGKSGLLEYMSFTEGEEFVSDCAVIFTTNNEGKVPSVLKERPSRLGIILEIKGIPVDTLYRHFSDMINNSEIPNKETVLEKFKGHLNNYSYLAIDYAKYLLIQSSIDAITDISHNKVKAVIDGGSQVNDDELLSTKEASNVMVLQDKN